MLCGNQDSKLGSLLAEHEVFALKNKTNAVTSSPSQTSQLPLDSHEAHFFFNSQEGIFRSVLSDRLAVFQVILKLADHKMASEETLSSPH